MPVFVHKDIILNSCSDIACCVFHDCIKCVESDTFLASPHCRKQYCTVYCNKTCLIKWRSGQNYKYLQHIFSECCMPNLIKLVDVSDLFLKNKTNDIFETQCIYISAL